jgi:hypothetical protein
MGQHSKCLQHPLSYLSDLHSGLSPTPTSKARSLGSGPKSYRKRMDGTLPGAIQLPSQRRRRIECWAHPSN